MPAWTPKTVRSVIEPLARERLAEEAHVQERGIPAAQFPGYEADGGDDTDDEAEQGRGGGPAPLGPLLQDEDEADHRDDGRQRADGVKSLPGRLAGVGNGSQRRDEGPMTSATGRTNSHR
jgi:hypothetical protein